MRLSVAGVAKKGDRYLIAKRKLGTSIGEAWEFPGGKVKRFETPEAALKREFREELSVPIRVGRNFCSGRFENRGKEYNLLAFYIDLGSENFQLHEHQEIRWVNIQEMLQRDFPESDKMVVQALQAQGK